ncbi:hypothetical protein [Rubricoccus marinus]|nr:hypothetical protein [Rubricoccus marinus]
MATRSDSTASPEASVSVAPPPVEAAPTIRFRGLGFFDYDYTLASPVEGEAGANTFDYRRLYLTADYTLSDAFDGRFRLEAQSSSTTAQGRPAPFVKDAFIRWKGPLAEGHSFRLGLQPPPLLEVVERVWGYRSLDRTLLDRARANDSRDFGLRADGPLAPRVSYSLMVGNGRGLVEERSTERGKHVYGQLQARPTEATFATLGLDYTPHEGEGEERDESVKASAFYGASGETVRAGVEAYAVYTNYQDPSLEPTQGVGASAFGVYLFGARGEYRLIGRYDFVQGAARRADADEHYGLLAFSYAPIPSVEVMPNVLVSAFEGQDASVTGRVTVSARF